MAEIRAGKYEDVFERKPKKSQKEEPVEEQKKVEFNVIVEERTKPAPKPTKKADDAKKATADSKQAPK